MIPETAQILEQRRTRRQLSVVRHFFLVFLRFGSL